MDQELTQRMAWNGSLSRHMRSLSTVARRWVEQRIRLNREIIAEYELANRLEARERFKAA